MLTRKAQGWLGNPGAPSPRVCLAAFGKHPGWDDHIEDLGLETEALVLARRVLYTEGLGGNIESGAWEKLEDAQRLAGFGHVVVWRRGAELLIARMWSSSDGKGRTRYPMVLCAHTTGVPMAWALHEVLPRLEKAHLRCAATKSADDVREIVQATRLKLRTAMNAASAELAAWKGDDVVADRELARLAESPVLSGAGTGPAGPARAGLLRVLYQVEREMQAFVAAGPSRERKSGLIAARAQQVRVPACGATPGEAGRLWTGVLLETLADAAPIMTVQAMDQRWLDVIVGEPAAANLFCVRATEKMIPLTSEVPYTLDPAFIARAQGMIDAWGRPDMPGGAERSAERGAARPDGPAPVESEELTPGGSRLWIAIVAAVVVVLVVALLVVMRGGPARTPAAPAEPGRESSSAAGPASIDRASAGSSSVEPAPVQPASIPPSPDRKPASGTSSASPSAPTGAGGEGFSDGVQPRSTQALSAGPAPQPAPPAVRESATAEVPRGDEPAAGLGSSGQGGRPAEERGPDRASGPALPAAAPPNGPAAEAVQVSAAMVSRAVRSGVSPDEPMAANGPTLAHAAESLSAGTPGGAAARAEVQRLREIGAMDDRAMLEGLIASGRAATAFESFAAWRRLMELGWPDRPPEFKKLARARDQVLLLADTIDDGARRPAVRSAVLARARSAAVRGMELAAPTSDAEFAEMLEASERVGVKRGELGPVAAFNIVILVFRTEFTAVSEQPASARESAARALLGNFVSRARSAPAEIAGREELVEPVGRLALLLEEPATSGPDLATIGPGRAGWSVQSEGDGSRLVYTAAPGAGGGPAAAIEFIHVRRDGVDAYVAREELSVGLASFIVGRAGAWPALRERRLLRIFDPKVNDPRAGPRGWTWSARRPGEIEIASQWIAAGSEAQPYAPGIDPGRPAADSPLQQAAVDGLIYIARLAGCRPPTAAEWRAARAMDESSGPANRRDATWARQRDYVASSRPASGVFPWPEKLWPDKGAFKLRGQPAAGTEERAQAATDEDDGWLWFAPTGAGSGPGFRHLVGNVAEVVCEDSDRLEELDPQRPELIDAALGDRGMIRVIGGSALSGPELDVDTAFPVERTPSREGWADVGVRLAFSAGGAGQGSLWTRARVIVETLPYLGTPAETGR